MGEGGGEGEHGFSPSPSSPPTGGGESIEKGAYYGTSFGVERSYTVMFFPESGVRF